MAEQLSIGAVARQSGVPTKTIRFYEAQGIVPTPARTETGYRLYSPTDVRRLRLIRRARLLGVPLPEVKQLADRALDATCADYGEQLRQFITTHRAAINQRIAELMALRDELDDLDAHVQHSQARTRPGRRVADCAYCPLLDEKDLRCEVKGVRWLVEGNKTPGGSARSGDRRGQRRRCGGFCGLTAPEPA